ncbi:MAG: M48 family metalloprotease [Desulfovibrionaceae bacterium]
MKRARLMARAAFTPLLILMLLVGLVAAPVAHAFLGDFSLKDEKELGEKFVTLIKAQMPLVEDPEITEYVRDLVNRIAAQLPPQPYDIQSYVLRNSAINAFAIPGGSIFVHTGLLLEFDHESQVAGVIAHELGHVSQRHIVSRINKSRIVSYATLAGVLAGMLVGGSGNAKNAMIMGSMGAGQAAMLNYSREDEREADHVGMNLLVKAGFPPTGLAEGFEIIRKKKWLGGTTMPAYLTTHPDVEERIDAMQQRIAHLPEAERLIAEDDTHFKRIQTLLRSRYTDPKDAVIIFAQHKPATCLDLLGTGIAYSRLNKMTEATAAFEQALACGPNDSLILREAGRHAFTAGDYPRAASLLQKTAILNPKDLMALFFLARLYDEQKHYGQAQTYYQRILRKLPEDAEVNHYFGRSLGLGGDYFHAHLYLAYSALYANDRKQLAFQTDKARGLAKGKEQKDELDKLDKDVKKREEFW